MLENYEPVKLRKKRFYDKFPEGRIIVELVRSDDKCALFKAMLYKNPDEQKLNLPLATGYSYEYASKGGASKYSWVENAEESSVGRALDNAGFAGNTNCSLEEITKVKAHELTEHQKANVLREPHFESHEQGEYIIPFGKFKGQPLSQVPIAQVENYLKWLEEKANQDGKPLSQSAKQLRDEVAKLKGSHQGNVAPDPLNLTEELDVPF